MQHQVAVALGTVVAGAVGAWGQTGTAILTPYVGGYIVGIRFSWKAGGVFNVGPCTLDVGYGPTGGPGIMLSRRIVPNSYTPAGTQISVPFGSFEQLDLRSPIPGGVLIQSPNLYGMARNVDAGAAAFFPTYEIEYVIWLP